MNLEDVKMMNESLLSVVNCVNLELEKYCRNMDCRYCFLRKCKGVHSCDSIVNICLFIENKLKK